MVGVVRLIKCDTTFAAFGHTSSPLYFYIPGMVRSAQITQEIMSFLFCKINTLICNFCFCSVIFLKKSFLVLLMICNEEYLQLSCLI